VKTKYGFLFSGPVLRIEGQREVMTMPGVNYRQLRSVISIAEVLQLIGFVPVQTCGPQLRGPCPVHASCFKSSRVFSVNLKTNAYRCFKCGSTGNQLDLYAAVTKKSLYEAAIDLCEKLNCPTPWIHRW
jgi:DNA primase